MIDAPAMNHRLFFHMPHARCCFARIGNLTTSALDSLNKCAGGCGNAGKMLQEIQRSALDSQQCAKRAGQFTDAVADCDPIGIVFEPSAAYMDVHG